MLTVTTYCGFIKHKVCQLHNVRINIGRQQNTINWKMFAVENDQELDCLYG